MGNSYHMTAHDVVADAARRFLALLPDEKGNHDPKLIDAIVGPIKSALQVSNALGFFGEATGFSDDRTRAEVVAHDVLAVVVGDTDQ